MSDIEDQTLIADASAETRVSPMTRVWMATSQLRS